MDQNELRRLAALLKEKALIVDRPEYETVTVGQYNKLVEEIASLIKNLVK